MDYPKPFIRNYHLSIAGKFADIYTLNLHGINERFSFNYLFLFSRHHIPTNSVATFSEYKPTLHPQFFQSLWRRANARNVSFLTLYGDQFTLSTQLIILNYPVKLSPTQHHSFYKNLPPLSFKYVCSLEWK